MGHEREDGDPRGGQEARSRSLSRRSVVNSAAPVRGRVKTRRTKITLATTSTSRSRHSCARLIPLQTRASRRLGARRGTFPARGLNYGLSSLPTETVPRRPRRTRSLSQRRPCTSAGDQLRRRSPISRRVIPDSAPGCSAQRESWETPADAGEKFGSSVEKRCRGTESLSSQAPAPTGPIVPQEARHAQKRVLDARLRRGSRIDL